MTLQVDNITLQSGSNRSTNWVMLVAFIFFLLGIFGVFQLNPGVVFAKLHSDSAVYFSQAKYLWENGTASNFSLGNGLPPIIYTPVPAYFRAPIFGISNDPITIVRLIQIQNIIILTLIAIISLQYLRLRLPNDLGSLWKYVPFVYIPLTYNPWVLNAFMPLGDSIYALLTMGSIVLLLSISQPLTQRKSLGQAIAFLVLLSIALIQKFTSIGLVVFLVRLFARRENYWKWLLFCSPIAAIMLFGFYSLHHVYVGAGLTYLTGRPIFAVLVDTAINLAVASIPSQILPNFGYLFSRDFAETQVLLNSAFSIPNIPWAIMGLAITCLVLLGLWQERHRMAPEIALLAVVVPIYAIVNDSTTRYLASIQPIFIVSFIIGFRNAWKIFKISRQISWLIMGVLSLAMISVIAVNITRSFTSSSSVVVLDLKQFLDELGMNFIAGRDQIDAISKSDPNVRFALVADDIRWYGLAGVRFIAPERSKNYLCEGFTVYTAFGCDKRNCDRLSSQVKQNENNFIYKNNITSSTMYEKRTYASYFIIKKLSIDTEKKCPIK